MRYKIHTAPIWDAFKQNDGCPLCKIKRVISDRLVSQYLNEAVMEPLYRINANKTGFCAEHINQMLAGDNKLGVSLQLATRTEYIAEQLTMPNKKNCKREAERILDNLNGCIICENTATQLSLHYETVATMYKVENDFPSLLGATKALCVEHYAELVKSAPHAGAKIDEYLSVLYRLEKAVLRKLKYNLDRFADMFDHQRGHDVEPEAKTATVDAIRIINLQK